MQILKVLTDEEQIEKFQKYRAQRNQAARNFKLRNMEKVKKEGKQLYDINKNKVDFKENGRRRAKLYYELNKDAVKAKRELKSKVKKAMETKEEPSFIKAKPVKTKERTKTKLKSNDDNIIIIEPTELKLRRGRPKKIVIN